MRPALASLRFVYADPGPTSTSFVVSDSRLGRDYCASLLCLCSPFVSAKLVVQSLVQSGSTVVHSFSHTLFLFQSLDRNPWTLADTLDAHTARKTQIATYKPCLYSRNSSFKYSPRILDRSTIQGVYLAIHWLIAHDPSHDPGQ